MTEDEMALTNAQRQARHRQKRSAAGTDAAILTRLFGPKLDLTDPQVAALEAASLEQARSVQWRGAYQSVAVDSLLMSVAHYGLPGIPAGWSLTEIDGGHELAIYRFKTPLAVAA